MGGLFGVFSTEDCIDDLFFGTDYHSHLGTRRGGLAVKNSGGFQRFIKDITNSQFRSKFKKDLNKLHGNKGIGVISDYDDQPLIINSNLGVFAITTVGKINNIDELANEALKNGTHFSEMHGGEINPTEMVATLISKGDSFVQAAVGEEGYVVEYRDDSGYFRGVEPGISYEKVVVIFVGFLNDNDSWKEITKWEAAE